MNNAKHNELNLNIKRSGLSARPLVSGMAGAMLALTGCAVELDALGEHEIVEQSAESIAELETRDGALLTFTVEYESGDGSGDPVVAITELAPLDAFPYLEHLRERGATSLETFLALSPEDAEAPALLHDVHEREASLLGRSAELRDLSLAEITKSTPFSSATCNSFAAFNNSVSSLLAVQTSSNTGSHSLTHALNGNVAAAMCNHNSSRVDYKYAQFCYEVPVSGSPFGLLVCDAKIIVPDGHRVNKTWVGATSRRLVRSEPLENYSLVVTSYIGIGLIPPIP